GDWSSDVCSSDLWLLRQEPCQRDLRRCRLLLFRNSAQQIHYPLICFPRLGRETGHDVAEIGTVERSLLVDLPGKEAFPQRTEWHEPNSELFQRRYYFRFRFSPPQRIFAL